MANIRDKSIRQMQLMRDLTTPYPTAPLEQVALFDENRNPLDLTKAEGPPGPKGDSGPQGDPGPMGPPGADGGGGEGDTAGPFVDVPDASSIWTPLPYRIHWRFTGGAQVTDQGDHIEVAIPESGGGGTGGGSEGPVVQTEDVNHNWNPLPYRDNWRFTGGITVTDKTSYLEVATPAISKKQIEALTGTNLPWVPLGLDLVYGTWDPVIPDKTIKPPVDVVPQVMVDSDGFVHFRGAMTGYNNGPMFTLPELYRPEFTQKFPVISGLEVARVFVLNDGTVMISDHTPDYFVDLSPLSWLSKLAAGGVNVEPITYPGEWFPDPTVMLLSKDELATTGEVMITASGIISCWNAHDGDTPLGGFVAKKPTPLKIGGIIVVRNANTRFTWRITEGPELGLTGEGHWSRQTYPTDPIVFFDDPLPSGRNKVTITLGPTFKYAENQPV